MLSAMSLASANEVITLQPFATKAMDDLYRGDALHYEGHAGPCVGSIGCNIASGALRRPYTRVGRVGRLPARPPWRRVLPTFQRRYHNQMKSAIVASHMIAAAIARMMGPVGEYDKPAKFSVNAGDCGKLVRFRLSCGAISTFSGKPLCRSSPCASARPILVTFSRLCANGSIARTASLSSSRPRRTVAASSSSKRNLPRTTWPSYSGASSREVTATELSKTEAVVAPSATRALGRSEL